MAFHVFLLFLFRAVLVTAQLYRPHIVIIVADDMGWNDVGFHGSDQIPTPNIDALAFNGVILNNLYTMPTCTPSRASLLTGRYPIHMGMQGGPLFPTERRGLPLEYKLLPGYLKNLGYKTHAVGKWHLGYATPEYAPQNRGFDSFFGYYNGYTGYYDYIVQNFVDGPMQTGLDVWNGTRAAWDVVGRYSTDVFMDEARSRIERHDPSSPMFLYLALTNVHAANAGQRLEAPQDYINRFRYILDPNRRVFAAMLTKLDEAVGQVVQTLKNKGMLDNSIILFMSDNGAPGNSNATYYNWGSNFPFRGGKRTLWEGGIRTANFIWAPQFQHSPRVSDQLMHVSDWLPTLYSAAGGSQVDLPGNLDGTDQWYSLTWNLPSRRSLALVNIDEKEKTAGIVGTFDTGIRSRRSWKLVVGRVANGMFDEIYNDVSGPSNPAYSYAAITNSTVYRALGSLYIPTANEVQMKILRKQATVECADAKAGLPVPDCRTRPCLFQLDQDPCETHDMTQSEPQIASRLYDALKYFMRGLVPQIAPDRQPELADPARSNYTWGPWS